MSNNEMVNLPRDLLAKPECQHDWCPSAISGMPDYCTRCGDDKPSVPDGGEPEVFNMCNVMSVFENASAVHLAGTSNWCAVMAKHLNKVCMAHITRLQAENAELRLQCGGMQMTIDELQAEVADRKAKHHRSCQLAIGKSQLAKERHAEIIRLQAELDALKAAQGEPVAWANYEQLILCGKSPRYEEPANPGMHNIPRTIAGSAIRTEYCNTPLYATPPAPVAVRITLQRVLKAYEYADAQQWLMSLTPASTK